MTNSIDRLKQINLIEHISLYLQKGKTEKGKIFFHSSQKDKTASLVVYEDQTKGYFDFSSSLGGGSIIDFEMNYFKIEKAEAIKKLCEKYGITDEKKEFKKAPKRHELVENFEDFRFNGLTPELSRFLQSRGFSFDSIGGEFKEKINEVSKEIGFCANQFVDKDTFKDVLIFPCLNENKEIVGAKLRRCDGEKIIHGNDYLKSIAVAKPKDYKGTQQFSTGILFNEINEKYVLICEGETDYLILKILGFPSVVGNLGGVSSNAEKIQQIVKNVDKIVCLYDNDSAGTKGALSLQEKIGRPIRMVKWKKIDGVDKYDVNDLFKMGYRKKDFDELIKNAEILKEEEIKEEQKLFDDRIFYNNSQMKYFDIYSFLFKNPVDIARHYSYKPKDFEELRVKKVIPTYEGICYYDGGKKGFFNLLDKRKISHPNEKPKIDPAIEFLISNICNYNEKNIEWLEKAILYKYTHLNDVLIPAVIFHGVQGTGKGLFMKLLSEIFGENNILLGLNQDSLNSSFSHYTGQKLIVEFKEVAVEDTKKGKKIMNKLQSLIMEEKIMIEKKGQDAISVENIAWFIMSSNDQKPLLLNSSDVGNRRFSIIKTGKHIKAEGDKGEEGIFGKDIEKAIKNKDNIESFLAYLFQKFPNIQTDNIKALDNEDKRELELLCDSVGNLFFKRIEEKYPHINKITNTERDFLLDMYRIDIGETDYRDDRYVIKYFNSGLSNRYQISNIIIHGKKQRGYKINKEIIGSGEFEENYFENRNIKKPKGIL